MAETDGKVARIARIWRGRTVPEKADAYAAYLLEAGVRPLAKRRWARRCSARTAGTRASS